MLGISKYIAYKLFIMKLQEYLRQCTPFSMTQKRGPQFYFQIGCHQPSDNYKPPILLIILAKLCQD